MTDTTELCFLSTVELLKRFAAGSLKPSEVLEAQIKRIEAKNDAINAITAKHYDEARAQARESDKRWAEGRARPLEGITVAVKDEAKVKGWRVSAGSLVIPPDAFEPEDGALATRLRAAGVVMHIQTNVPEFWCNTTTWNRLPLGDGVCRNPWNPKYTCGGSSGGAGASLAAGFCTLATGSDMGGSIRIPSSMNGVFGFKPPYGRVATSLCQYESDGPMARTAEDLALFANALAGPSPLVVSSLRPKLDYPTSYPQLAGLRIAVDFLENWGAPVDAQVTAALQKAVDTLRAQGAIVDQVHLDLSVKDLELWALGLFSTAMGPLCFAGAKAAPELVTSYSIHNLETYEPKISPDQLVRSDAWVASLHRRVQERVFIKGYRALLMPTMITPYLTADHGRPSLDIEVNGEMLTTSMLALEFIPTWHWNSMGQYPVLSVPIGLARGNVPMGMQIIGDTYDDLAAFQVASHWTSPLPPFPRE